MNETRVDCAKPFRGFPGVCADLKLKSYRKGDGGIVMDATYELVNRVDPGNMVYRQC